MLDDKFEYLLRLGDNALVLSFFRRQGMMAGPFIPLEMALE